MARTRKPKIEEKDLHCFKHFRLLLPVLERLHDDACARDKVGNRKLHFDQYTALILLYFFNPIVTSLRGIQLSPLQANTRFDEIKGVITLVDG